MVWYPAYLDDKQDVVDWASNQNNQLTTGDIPDVLMRMSDSMIWRHLSYEGIHVNYTGTVSGNQVEPADINGFLWAASVAFTLEQMSYRGNIHYTPGGLELTRFGQVTHKFMRMQPMFFIPRGTDIEEVDPVMPFRSFKQMGQVYVDAYINAYKDLVLGRRVVIAMVDHDMSSRGYGWNAKENIRVLADKWSSGMT